jgi:hypothetical protein
MTGRHLRSPYSYLLATLAALLVMPHLSAAQSPPAAGSAIYLVRRGWHIEVGFDVAELQPPLNSLVTQFPGARYLFFGFGDQHYLLAKHHNGPVLLGALWPGRAMLLVTGLSSPPQQAFGADQVAVLAVAAEQTRRAQAFIWQSLDTRSLDRQSSEALASNGPERSSNSADQLKPYQRGPYEGSLYFSATPTYSAFHTCNTWAAEVLHAATLPVHSGGVVFAGQLWRQVRRLERRLSAEPPRASLPGAGHVQAAQLQGGLVPSWHTTVVPEF